MAQIKRYNPAWGSHMPVLVKIMEISSGPVLELGMGAFSTPLLHMLCFNKGRKLHSYEGDQRYFDMHGNFRSDFHQIDFAEDWDKINIEDTQWGVAFVDHEANRRSPEVKRLVSNAKYVIIHDSDPDCDKYYNFSSIYPLFQYRFDYTKAKPHTTVLSNFIDVSQLEI